jgi:hypothetical protein
MPSMSAEVMALATASRILLPTGRGGGATPAFTCITVSIDKQACPCLGETCAASRGPTSRTWTAISKPYRSLAIEEQGLG